jgi:hypothetical protein
MTSATDTDIQQLKDLIIAGNIATQKQITDGNTAMQKQITDGNTVMQKQITDGNAVMQKQITDGNAVMQKQITDGSVAMQKQIADLTLEMKVGFTKLEGDIETLSSSVQNFEKRMSEMSNDQRAQDQRFFSLSIFIITFAVGVAAKLAKLY